MTVVDRATKRVTLIPMLESVTAAGAADLFPAVGGTVLWDAIGGNCRPGPPFYVCLLAVTILEARYQPAA